MDALKKQNRDRSWAAAMGRILRAANRPVIPAATEGMVMQAVADHQALHPSEHFDAVQQHQARVVATSEWLVDWIGWYADTGRNRVSEVVVAAVQAGGGRVVGLGPSLKAVTALSTALAGSPAHALSLWLKEREEVSCGRAAMPELKPGDLLIVTEAHTAGPQHIAAVIDEAEANGALVRLAGSISELRAMGIRRENCW